MKIIVAKKGNKIKLSEKKGTTYVDLGNVIYKLPFSLLDTMNFLKKIKVI